MVKDHFRNDQKASLSFIRICACQSNIIFLLSLSLSVTHRHTEGEQPWCSRLCCVWCVKVNASFVHLKSLLFYMYLFMSLPASAHHSLAMCVCVCVGCSHPCVWRSQRAVQLWLWLHDGHLEAKLVNGASKPTASRPSPCWAESVC